MLMVLNDQAKLTRIQDAGCSKLHAINQASGTWETSNKNEAAKASNLGDMFHNHIRHFCLHDLHNSAHLLAQTQAVFSGKKTQIISGVVSHRESWGGLLEGSASHSCKLKSDWVLSRLATHGPGSFGWLNSLQNLPFQKGKSWLSKHRLKDGPTAAIMPRLNAKVSAEFVDCKAAGERWGTRTWRVQHKGFRSFIFVYIYISLS